MQNCFIPEGIVRTIHHYDDAINAPIQPGGPGAAGGVPADSGKHPLAILPDGVVHGVRRQIDLAWPGDESIGDLKLPE